MRNVIEERKKEEEEAREKQAGVRRFTYLCECAFSVFGAAVVVHVGQ